MRRAPAAIRRAVRFESVRLPSASITRPRLKVGPLKRGSLAGYVGSNPTAASRGIALLVGRLQATTSHQVARVARASAI